MAKKVAKKRRQPDRIGGRDPVAQLYRAVKRYVEHHGGHLVIIGGISIIQFPDDSRFNFSVAIRCTGKLPVFSQPEAPNAK